MSSSIKLTNSSGKIVTITNPDTTSADVAVDLLNNAYTIATVDDFGTVPVGYTTVIVKDTDRGGIFVWSASGTANGGTVFAGSSGYWVRQYSGAVNVKWFGAKGDGVTDDTTAIQSALDIGKTVFFPAMTYKCSTTLETKDGSIIGEMYRVDDAVGSTVILSTANPILKTSPYPGTEIKNIKIKGAGTSTSIEIFDTASYDKQIGILAGRTSSWMTVADGDNYNVGGSGGLYLDNVTFSNINGWAFYAYKLWGQSTLNNLFFYNCGHSTDTNSGCMAFVSECVDTNITNVHMIPYTAVAATGIQLGASKTASDLMNRFYIGPAHIRFSNILSEGYSKSIREYFGVNCHFIDCQFSFGSITIGEDPVVYYQNITTNFISCGFYDETDIYCNGEYPIGFMNCNAETATTLHIGGSSVSAFKNSNFIYDVNYTTERAVVLNAEQSNSIPNICSGYKTGTWVLTGGTPAVNQINSDIDRLLARGSGQPANEIYTELSGLEANSIVTIMFAIEVYYQAYYNEMKCKVWDSSGTVIKSINYANSGVIAPGTPRKTITTNVKVPSNGIIRVGYYQNSTNFQRYFNPIVIKGMYQNILEGIGVSLNDSKIYGTMIFNDRKIFLRSAIPTSGSYNQGDMLFYTSPAAGGKVGAICVTSGTPGTWKAFGPIDA